MCCRRFRRLPKVFPPAGIPDASGATTVYLSPMTFLKSLLRNASLRVPCVPLWSPAMRPWLVSAVAGGQWTQSRKSKIDLAAAREVDLLCQLCHNAEGTLLHRWECSCTLPEGGWLQLEDELVPLVADLPPARRDLLRTRGLAVHPVRIPPPRDHSSVIWLTDIPDPAEASRWRWYTDGSAFFMGIVAAVAAAAAVAVDARGNIAAAVAILLPTNVGSRG